MERSTGRLWSDQPRLRDEDAEPERHHGTMHMQQRAERRRPDEPIARSIPRALRRRHGQPPTVRISALEPMWHALPQGHAMLIPRAVTVFNKYVNNRVQGLWAWLLPPWAVIGHIGRKSGRPYRTPVLGFVGGGRFAVPILYGEQTDWARNLLAAGGGTLHRAGRRYALQEPRIVPRGEVTMHGLGGWYARLAPSALVATLGPRQP